jgi:serine/threonine protein kinase/tetratricopeptide (TPR) repeat protein
MGDDPKQDGDVDPVVFEDEDDDAQEHATREPLRFSAPIEDLPRGTTVASHVILGRVASGGMGVVYAAFDPDLDRKVAIKLLQIDDEDEEEAVAQREHLLRQVEAATKVSHPAVAQVHDVGTFDGGVFIATEFIDGIDLRQWMEARDDPFPWHEVLRVFTEAGRGLAAAHAMGVVHGDFKPSNVLLGKGGRICVVDFGLAHRVQEEDEDRDLSISELRKQLPSHITNNEESIPELTDGARYGTPAYMAPEQHVGATADARSDQFAFCVAFYEALYGERPFKGTRRSTIALEAINNRVREVPSGSDVPQWIRDVLLRGLSPRRSDRYPSMEALLRALDYDPKASRKRWIAGVAALTILGAGAASVWWLVYSESKRCEPNEALLTGIWDPRVQEELHEAFVSTGDPLAEDTWAAVKGSLDEWVQEYLDFRSLACSATRVSGEASEELLTMRNACLDERLGKVAAFGRVYANPTRATLHRAQQVALSIPLPRWCVPMVSLQAATIPPESMSERITELREEHDEAFIAWKAGQLAYARAGAESVYDELDDIDYPPLRISTLILLGSIDRDAGDLASSRRRLHEAAAQASAAGLQLFVARAWAELLITVSRESPPPRDADVWAEYALAMADHTGDELVQADLFAARAEIARASGRAADALSLYHRALAALDSDIPGTRLRGSMIEARLGSMMAEREEWASAVSYLQRSLDSLRSVLGPEHPELIGPMRQLADVAQAQGKLEDAVALLDRALSIEIGAHGEATAAAAELHVQIGRLAQERGHMPAASQHFAAAATAMEQNAPDKGRLDDARTRELVARALWDRDGERPRAERFVEQARAGYETAGDAQAAAMLDAWVEQQKESR